MTIRLFFVFLFDVFAVFFAWGGGLLLRFNFVGPSGYNPRTLWIPLTLLFIHAVACHWAGVYRGIWRFASMPDLKRVLRAVSVSSIGLVVIKALTPDPGMVLPRTMLVLYPVLLTATMCGGRLIWRMWKDHHLTGRLAAVGDPVVIVGAGRGGAMLIPALTQSADWRVVALVDDDRTKWGLELSGFPIEGGIDDLPEVLARHRAKHVILAMPSALPVVTKRAANIAIGADAQVFIVPGIEELMCGRVEIDSMRPVAVDDLLGREPVYIDTAHVQKLFAEGTVLVTGAGGSIGSELCRQIARFEPETLVLLEASEFALYSISEWFAVHRPETKIVPLIGDIRSMKRNEEIFTAWRPQVVFHAAAYKHVPLMETHNAWQAVRNNAFGTLQLARCAHRHGVACFVMVSTDKAVNPTNIMGASKRLAEMICQTFAARSDTRFVTVRFGNVLGSTGSVVPKFQAQIASGGPVTVTHPEITRYFMSIPEAAQLLLQAAAQGQSGEICVLDMGEPVRIADLARSMIRLSGYTEAQIGIEFTGLRPGEKLFEELLADAEQTRPTSHPKLRIALARPVAPDTPDFFGDLQTWLEQDGPLSDDEVRRDIWRWVSEYAPSIPAFAAEDEDEDARLDIAPAA